MVGGLRDRMKGGLRDRVKGGLSSCEVRLRVWRRRYVLRVVRRRRMLSCIHRDSCVVSM
jgi:hypothetical protein